jgi:hypothetical protein
VLAIPTKWEKSSNCRSQPSGLPLHRFGEHDIGEANGDALLAFLAVNKIIVTIIVTIVNTTPSSAFLFLPATLGSDERVSFRQSLPASIAGRLFDINVNGRGGFGKKLIHSLSKILNS